MKFAVITDIHHGPGAPGTKGSEFGGIQRKLVKEAETLVSEFVDTVNKINDLDFVINLGDSIEDLNEVQPDIKNFKKIQSILSKIIVPTYTLIGNHDQKTLSFKELEGLLGYEKLYYSFEVDGIKCICLCPEVIGDHRVDPFNIKSIIDPIQLKWLKEELNTDKPSIIFSHYSAAEMNMKDNYWFDGSSQYALLSNREEVRSIIEESRNVIAYLNGHVHWNNLTIHKNLPYITQQSISENFTNEGIPAKTFSIVEIKDNIFDMVMYGNDRTHVKFKF